MDGFDGIVVGVESLDLSRDAIAWAMREAQADGSQVRLIHAVDWSTAAKAALWGAVVPPELMPEQIHAAFQEELDNCVAYARECAPGVEVDADIYEGDRVMILRDAGRNASMIVIGSRKLGIIESALFGSTGTGLAHTSHVPFVVVRGRSVTSPEAPIVVGVDATAATEGVLAEALRIASANHRPLRVVACWEAYYYAPLDRAHGSTESVREQAEIWLSEAIAGWQEKYPDVQIERALLYDYPAAGLIEQSRGAALVVVGVGGNRLQRMLGSVAGSVLHHASCPVAVIPLGGVG